MERIYTILSDLLDRDPQDFNIDSVKDDFENWDSITIINLAVSLEEEFNVSLTAEDIEQLVSVRAIADSLRRQGVSNL